jgi:EAL domain-containing protein (putative c-di-GMP-specific phosphodiesterase class I)
MKKQLWNNARLASGSKIRLSPVSNRNKVDDDLRAHDRSVDGGSPRDLDIAFQPIVSVNAPLGSLDFEVVLLNHPAVDRAVLGQWLLAAALDRLEAHESVLKMTRFVCVDLHAEAINDGKSLAKTLDILRRHQKLMRYVCLQISETTRQVSWENLQHFLVQSQEMGAKVALSDFGSMYGSFQFLRTLSVDALKIDRTLLGNVGENAKYVAIAEGMIMLAHNLGVTSIATGLNDIRTLQLLIELGVDYVQGPAIARPQQPETLADASAARRHIEEAALATLLRAADATKHPLTDEDATVSPRHFH